jgi:hypothetical protein
MSLTVLSGTVTTAIDKCTTICYTSEGLNKNHVAVPTQVGTCLTFDLCCVTDDGIFRTAKTRRPIQNNEFVSCVHVAVCAVTRVALVTPLALVVILASSAMFELRSSRIQVRRFVTAVTRSAVRSSAVVPLCASVIPSSKAVRRAETRTTTKIYFP